MLIQGFTGFDIKYSSDQERELWNSAPEEHRLLADPATLHLHASHQKEAVTCPIYHLDYLYLDQHRVHVRVYTQ